MEDTLPSPWASRLPAEERQRKSGSVSSLDPLSSIFISVSAQPLGVTFIVNWIPLGLSPIETVRPAQQ
jgi:hypothetical protein